ncbi:putative sporulation protein YtxC [Clostridium tyrobutyricum]|uniref:putative sporulation protein YtxC n=1 Tax=Clostridium tyrobutyricum TaxID=1519 RepID=UPI001C38E3DE|nr:putative sporulation protein YtxC [Clostridium tyrobutyricum]MBV4419515.1 putative sporulation protein YtxC [Clostridium tyrobutyricum]
MPLLNLIYNNEREDIINGVKFLKQYFKQKNINIGVSESMESGTHFLKIYSDCELNKRLANIFNIQIANIVYGIIVKEFYKKEIDLFLQENYFFLQNDEIDNMKNESYNLLMGDISIIDENSIYCINKKNNILEEIIDCMRESNNINIEGFIAFRMKNTLSDLKNIIDKVVEKYMVEKEYDEFIKLLKYFVEIQESKIEYMDIVIEDNGDYIVRNEQGIDITNKLFNELTEFKTDKDVSSEDLLISVLITNSPQNICIHSVENCRNSEIIDTIQKVFTDRVKFYNSCNV